MKIATPNDGLIYHLSPRAQRAANRLTISEANPARARLVYLNALAAIGTGNYLRHLGFGADLQEQPLRDWNNLDPGAEKAENRGDLRVRSVGTIECRPVLPGQAGAVLPPTAQRPRVAVILVEVNEERAYLKILGFMRGAPLNRSSRVRAIPLLVERRSLEPPLRLSKYLMELRYTTMPRLGLEPVPAEAIAAR